MIFGECSSVKRRSQSKSGKSKSGRSILDDKRARVLRCIRGLPAGMVSSYGAVAKAAGWAGAARQVVRILQQVPGLPWHRVVGSGGAIKLCGENAAEQTIRLRVDMKRHEFQFSKVKRPKVRRAEVKRVRR